MLIKLMANNDMPDDSPYKGFDIFYVKRFKCTDNIVKCYIDNIEDYIEIYMPDYGSIYVMNDSGKTISSFSISENMKTDLKR